jgi:hypothetical protein
MAIDAVLKRRQQAGNALRTYLALLPEKKRFQVLLQMKLFIQHFNHQTIKEKVTDHRQEKRRDKSPACHGTILSEKDRAQPV